MEPPRVCYHWFLNFRSYSSIKNKNINSINKNGQNKQQCILQILWSFSLVCNSYVQSFVCKPEKRKKILVCKWMKKPADNIWFIFWKCNVMILSSASLIVTVLFSAFQVTCLLILVADILVYALYLSPVAFDYLPLRIAPYIRVVLFMLNFR
jgi:hypothetical protein